MELLITVLISLVTGTASGIAGNAIYELMRKPRKKHGKHIKRG